MKQKSKQVGMSLALLFLACFAMAQQRTVTGKVVDESGNPLPAVSYLLKSTKSGGTTNAEGEFQTQITGNDAVLVFSSVNHEQQEVAVGSQTELYVIMQSKTGNLEEVVVTALGIQRQKKSLGYAVQEIQGDALVQSREVNVSDALSGKVAGLQIIKSSTGPAGSAKIVLRGYNSLTGSNQPLIVVDGIPIDNFTGADNNDYWYPSLDMGSGLNDINAEDIASMSVLKGPSAAALYGSRAGNGVILITTKTGRKSAGIGLTLSATVGTESIFTSPRLQNAFGQGSEKVFDNRSSMSWGPRAEGQMVENWKGEQEPLRIYDNIKNYFGTGLTQNYNLSFSQQFDKTSVYTSVNRTEDKGLTPGVKLTRTNLTARAVSKFGADDRWTTDTKIQYINSIANNRPLGGNNTENQFFTIMTLPRSLDIRQFKHQVNDEGKMVWFGGGNQINPYWANTRMLNQDARDRFLLSGSLKYAFASWLTAEVRGGADLYTSNSEGKTYAGGPERPSGIYSLGKTTFKETNFSTLITAQKNDLIGRLGAALTLGGNLMDQEWSSLSANSGLLEVPDLFSLNNGIDKPTIDQGFTHRKTNSVYGSLTLNWDSYLYLDATLRNDWSSTLIKENRSFAYPSVSLSYVLTEHLNSLDANVPEWLSYAKLRASYASVGNDLDPYQLYNTYEIGKDPNGNTVAFRNKILFDPNVKSELIKSYEAGAELRFFRNRVGLDISFYKSNAINQLIDLPMDPLSGYEKRKINAGNIQNKGVEIMADVRMSAEDSKLGWVLSANFSHNENSIVDLYEGSTIYPIGGYDDLSIVAEKGKKYGEIYGTDFKRVQDKGSPYYGQLLLTSDGLPQRDPNPVRLGNQQASALLGITNQFTYKGVSLSFLFDGRFGGQIFSGTNSEMQQNGTAAATVVNGKREDMVVTGVQYDATTEKYTQNSTAVTPQQYWTAVAGTANLGIISANIYDATNVRLRNVQLGYELPRSLIANSPFQRAKVGVSVNNVWLITSHLNGVDPESVYATGTNAVGFENVSPPTTRSVLFNLTLGF